MTLFFSSQSATHREFSNFAPFAIDLDGAHWPTTEHYYQAQKFADAVLREKIRTAREPLAAKTLADDNRAAVRADWDAIKDDVMYRAVRRKFELHRTLMELLLATGEEEIVEQSMVDYYWGAGRDGTGQNRLGTIIQRIRAELRSMSADPAG